MFRLRLSIGLMIAWFLAFYNIERVDETINIEKFVYVLIPISVMILLTIPNLFVGKRLYFLIAPTLLVYALLKIRLDEPLIGLEIPLMVVELVSIIISIMVARQVAGVMLDFEDTIAKITFQSSGLPPRLFESVTSEELYREVKRSRRFQHPLVLLIFKPNTEFEDLHMSRILVDMQKSMAARYMEASIAKLLSDELRDVDYIAQHEEGLAVLMPEISVDDARRFATILRTQAKTSLGIELKVGAASFPDSAITLGGLIDAAEHDLETSTLGGDQPLSGTNND